MMGYLRENIVPGILVGAFMLLIVQLFEVKQAQAVTAVKVDTIIVSIDQRLGRIEEFIDSGVHNHE